MNVPAEKNSELLYWVDGQDQVIGPKQRKQVHDKKLLHREVALLVYSPERRVLFQKRSLKKRSNPGKWSVSVAGHIIYGQNPEITVVKEAEEEIGLKGFGFEYLGKELVKEEMEQHFTYWYMTEVPETYEFRINPEEVDEVKFITKDELKKAKQKGQVFNPVFVEKAELFWQGQIRKGLK